MSKSDVAARALRDLKEHAAKEQDVEKLQHLVKEINVLLDVIEIRLRQLESGGNTE